jgi:hypothetical protein
MRQTNKKMATAEEEAEGKKPEDPIGLVPPQDNPYDL